MKLREWIERATRRIPRLDAELIALEYFVHPDMEKDRSWLVLHQDEDLTKLLPDNMPEREVVVKALQTPSGFLTREELKFFSVHDAVIASQHTPYSRPMHGNYRDSMLQYANLAVEERVKGVPLAYILGWKEFYGRDFLVTPEVLIPRVETESIVNLAKQLDLPDQAHILEVGTGSGCLAITLSFELSGSEVIATDISDSALMIAEQNKIFHGANVNFYHSNLLQEFDFSFGIQDDYFDVVVANLPYVNPEWDWLDKEALSYEPKTALYAKAKNGLSFYERLLKEIARKMIVNYLILEADPCQHQELIELARNYHFVYLKTEGFALLFESRHRSRWSYAE